MGINFVALREKSQEELKQKKVTLPTEEELKKELLERIRRGPKS